MAADSQSLLAPMDTVKALVAGGAAGTCVDIMLFPLDTIKTRLQSEAGFWKSGGVRGIYSGLLSAALGSAPTAAVFFLTYESTKNALRFHTSRLQHNNNERHHGLLVSASHMAAACAGEIIACLIRVPVEVVKQRTQALNTGSSLASFKLTLRQEGVRGFYRGYFSTIFREVPFSMIQFPLWEYMKRQWAARSSREEVSALQSSVCGAVAGGISAALTTPLDVVKTRIMLADRHSSLAKGNIAHAFKQVYREKGMIGLFAGIGPRVLWISIGGSIFLGIYDKVRMSL